MIQTRTATCENLFSRRRNIKTKHGYTQKHFVIVCVTDSLKVSTLRSRLGSIFMFRHITANKHVCVFNRKQMFKKDKEMFTSAGNLNTDFYVIVALVTDSLFMAFLGRKLQCSLLPVEALQGDCGVIRYS